MPQVLRTAMDRWHQTTTAYFERTHLTVDERKRFPSARDSDEVVLKSLQQSGSSADAFFLGAIGSAGTHAHIVRDVGLNRVPPIFVERVADILHYAKAICDAPGFAVQGKVLAFVFGAIQMMYTVALNNLELFLGLADRFEEAIKRLKQGVYYFEAAKSRNKSEIAYTVLAEIIRFCGQVTAYMDGEPHTVPSLRFSLYSKTCTHCGRFRLFLRSSGVGQNGWDF
jgi:hypothetical protein